MVKNFKYNYPVILTEQEEGGYVVQFVDFPEAITQGETIEDALNEAEDCLEEAIANRIVSKLDVPPPSNITTKQYSVQLSPAFIAQIEGCRK